MNNHQVKAFWSKVGITDSKRDCWLWTGAKKPKGYGNVKIDKKYYLAHRVAFEIVNGKIPDAFIACHICDTPSCCNPNHIMLGTIKSNAADMLIKNRQKTKESAAKGSINGNSKLTDSSVREIRRLYKDGSYTRKMIADAFNISTTTAVNIVTRRTWSHI